MKSRRDQLACSVGHVTRMQADAYAQEHDVTLTETVRRAVALLAKVDKGEYLIVTDTGRPVELFL